MPIKQLISLQDYLETCFKNEGLYGLLPEDRKESLLTIPLASIWFFLLWFIQASLILWSTHYRGWIMSVILMPLLLGASFLVMVFVLLIRHLKEYLQSTPPDLSRYLTKIGMFFLVVFPVILIISTGLYLKSLLVPLYQLGLSLIAMLVAIILNTQKSKVRLLLEFFRSAWKLLIRSVGLIFVLLPVLLAIVMLSVFSSDLWAAIGNLSYLRLLVGTMLMILPAFLLMLGTLQQTSQKILGTFPSLEEIVRRAERYPLLEKSLQKGLISTEEWAEAKNELAWRHSEKLAQDFVPIIQRKVKHWLILLLFLTCLLVTLTFFTYFFALFRTLLQPNLIAEWVGIAVVITKHTWSVVTLPFLGPLITRDFRILG